MTVRSMEERRVWMNDGGNACIDDSEMQGIYIYILYRCDGRKACLEDGGIANGENSHSGFLPSPGLCCRSATLS